MTATLTALQTTTYPACSYSLLLNVENENRLLLDCGPSILDALWRVGIHVSKINYIFLSHFHGDQMLGIPSFIFGQYAERFNGKFGPEKIVILSDNSVFKQALNISKVVYPSEMEKLRTEYGVRIIPASLTPFKTRRFKPFSAKAAEMRHSSRSFGLRIELSKPKTVVTYSGDTEPCENILKLAKRADWLIHDAFTPHKLKKFTNSIGHSTALQAAIIARKSKAKRLILANQWHKFSGETEMLKDEAETVFSGEVLTIRDSLKIDL